LTNHDQNLGTSLQPTFLFNDSSKQIHMLVSVTPMGNQVGARRQCMQTGCISVTRPGKSAAAHVHHNHQFVHTTREPTKNLWTLCILGRQSAYCATTVHVQSLHHISRAHPVHASNWDGESVYYSANSDIFYIQRATPRGISFSLEKVIGK